MMENNFEAKISKILLDVGVNPANKGYEYLKAGIGMCYNDRALLSQVTRVLYPAIARRFEGATPASVERCMRHSVDTLFDCVPPEELREYMRGQVKMKNGKVTVSTFIATVIEYIKYHEAWEGAAV